MAFSTITALIPIITIFVHGTRPTELVPPLLQRFIAGIESVLCVEKEAVGLISSNKLNNREYLTELSRVYCLSDHSSADDFYFYSWSGKLNPKARKNASIHFGKELIELIKIYEKKYEKKPIIRIITHSHGGNVALLMGQYIHEIDPSIIIDNLILLACPIQNATKHLAEIPIFKKIYNIHSHNDWLQVLDPQGIHKLIHEKVVKEFFGSFHDDFHLFSQRHFACSKEHIIEVAVRWEKNTKPQDHKKHLFPKWLQQRLTLTNKIVPERGLLHIEFTLLPFISMLPKLIFDIDFAASQIRADYNAQNAHKVPVFTKTIADKTSDKKKNEGFSQDITIIL